MIFAEFVKKMFNSWTWSPLALYVTPLLRHRRIVAQSRTGPLPQPRLNARALIEHWRTVPALDAQALREDLAAVLDLDL